MKSNILNHLNSLVNSLYETRYSIPNRTLSFSLEFLPGKVSLYPLYKVDYSDISMDNLLYNDYYQYENLVLHLDKKASFSLVFSPEEDFDGYLNSPMLEIYDQEDFVKDITDIIELSEKSQEKLKFLDDKYLSVYYEIEIIWENCNPKFSILSTSGNFKKFLSIIQYSEEYSSLYNNFLKLFNNHNQEIISKFSLEEIIDDSSRDYLKEIKDQANKYNNICTSFLSKTIGRYLEDKAFYLTSDNRKPISEAFLIEHQGYDFHWNSYPIKIKNPLTNYVHYFYDKSWKQLPENKELSGESVRYLAESDGNNLLKGIYSSLKDSLSENIFNYSYMEMKLYLTKGDIEDIIIEYNSIYGLTQKGEVVFFFKSDKKFKEEVILNKELFINNLNNLIN